MTVSRQSFTEKAARVVGAKNCLTGEDMAGYLQDTRGVYHGEAWLVARPKTSEEVSALVRLAAEHGVSITAQGGNTGLCGGSVPTGTKTRPALVLSLARMHRILDVNAERYTISAEAGCTLQEIHDAAEQADRSFAMDWGARGTATIGGALSTNAGGINVLRYGTARAQVLGLKAVLADGRIWDGMRALHKDSSGYDLKQMFIGGEGTIGIITEAVLKLHPRPREQCSMLAALSDPERIMEVFTLAKTLSEGQIDAFELLPGSGIDRVAKDSPAVKKPIEASAAWYILLRFAGREGIETLMMNFFETAQKKRLIGDAVLAQNQAQEENLWLLRDEIPPLHLHRLGITVLKWDIAVPIDSVMALLSAVEERIRNMNTGLQIEIYAFGHIGDGNLHLTMWSDADDARFKNRADEITNEVDRLVWRFNGTICAEHGVGVENLHRLQGQKSPLELEMMTKLRRLFDPDEIFNPGKLLPPG